MKEPASFAFLAGHSTVEEYLKQREAGRMTFRAKRLVVAILLAARKRLIKGADPSLIVDKMLQGYYREWAGEV